MRYDVDFTIEPLKKRSHGQKQTVKPRQAKSSVMDAAKSFKNPPNIREYWRLHKLEQRAKQKERQNTEYKKLPEKN